MDFSFTEDQQLIATTAQDWLAQVSDSAAVRDAMQTETGFNADTWVTLTQEMGWQLTHIPEAFDGLGLGYVELCILMEHMGKRLLCAPFMSTVALGVNALLVAGTEQQKTHVLPKVASGQARLTLAYAGAGRHRFSDPSQQCRTAEPITANYSQHNDGYVLNGDYSYVVDGHTASTLIVAARNTKTDGLGLFLVDASANGVTRTWTPSVDQTRKLASVTLNQVTVKTEMALSQVGAAESLFDDILALANIAIAAEQMGVADQVLHMTVDYIKERKQFGRAVGGFQAMKHKAADMMNKAEAARSAVYYAACIADEYLHGNELGQELQEAASVAKSYCCDAAYFNAGCAIQMHGGVGFTWEYDVHLYFKRAKAAQLCFGDSAWHREKIASQLLGPAQ